MGVQSRNEYKPINNRDDTKINHISRANKKRYHKNRTRISKIKTKSN